MNADSLFELFEMIDGDGSGQVEVKEFVDGIGKIAVSGVQVEFLRILKQVDLCRKEIKEIARHVDLCLQDIASNQLMIGQVMKRFDDHLLGTTCEPMFHRFV